MKADTAERLAERVGRVSDELNEMARDVEANERDLESVRLRQGIGRVMWAVYYEILKPTLEEHPSLERPAPASAPDSTRPRQPRRSRR